MAILLYLTEKSSTFAEVTVVVFVSLVVAK